MVGRAVPQAQGAPASAASPDDPMPQAPERPLALDCCGGGCDPCVFDLHAEALAHHARMLAAWRLRHPHAAPEDGGERTG